MMDVCITIYNIKKGRQMLPPQPNVLLRLIKSNTSFLLYGQKASGKTKLIHRLLQETQARYIGINCTLTSKKQNFLWLFNVELRKHLKSEGIQMDSLGSPTNLDNWISDLKKTVNQRRELAQALDNIYVFMDNIEEMVFQETFISSFYNACQKEFSFRFSFIFCGINFLRKQYTLDLPFRTMISFCMPKPKNQFNAIIDESVSAVIEKNTTDKEGRSKMEKNQIQKGAKYLSRQIGAAFEDIQSNLEKMKSIANVVTTTIMQQIEPNCKDIYKHLVGIVNRGELKKITQQVIEHGPLQENLLKHKIMAFEGDQAYEGSQNLEYYPQLILASIHMADYYPEKQDKRRFQDYKGRTNHRNKDLKRNDFKSGKHNLHRIIAIAEALQSQAKQNDKQLIAEHHTLDFYATFQNLRNENRLKFSGSKASGVIKEQQVKAFISKCELRYEQFMSS